MPLPCRGPFLALVLRVFGLSSQVPWKQNLAGDCPVVKLNVVSGPSGMFFTCHFLGFFSDIQTCALRNHQKLGCYASAPMVGYVYACF